MGLPRWLKFGAPPPPPPAPFFDLHEVAGLGSMWIIYTLILLCFHSGKWGTLKPNHARLSWMAVPVMACAFLLVESRSNSGEHASAALGVMGPTEIAYLAAWVIPIAGFGLLLLSEVALYLFALAAPEVIFAYLRHPVMAVHASTLMYYIYELTSTTRSLDAFGRPIYPLRYLLWACSVSAMLISVYYVVETTLRQLRDPHQRLAALHGDISSGLLYVDGTFTCGFLAGLRGPWGRQFNALFFVASCYFFYAMHACLDRMLAAIQEAATHHHARGIAFQFKITRVACLVIWHVFPVVWALAACDSISTEAEHVGYIVGDLLAKFLLLFVYVASVNNHTTQRQLQNGSASAVLSATAAGAMPAVGVAIPLGRRDL